jgi:hypothetical protein
MKTIFSRQMKRSRVRPCKQRLLTAGLLLAFLAPVVLMMVVEVAANDTKNDLDWQQLAQETGGYWQLVETIENPVSEDLKYQEEINSSTGAVCATITYNLSEGSSTRESEWYQSEECWRYSGNFNAVATWSRPPERITHGTPVPLYVKVSATKTPDEPLYYWSHQIQIWDKIEGERGERGGIVCGVRIKTSDYFLSGKPDPFFEEEECIWNITAYTDEKVSLIYHIPMIQTGEYGPWSEQGGGYRYIYQWVPAEEKPADTVPQPPKPTDSEPDTEYQRPPSSDPGGGSSGGGGGGWVVVVGGLAVMGAAAAGFTGLAAAAAVLVRRAKKKRLEDGDPQVLEDDEIVGYILQLSTDEIMLKGNQVQPVAIDCWQVTADGGYKAAPEASIQIQPPPASSGINVWPLSGQGSLDVHIQLDGLPPDYQYHVVVYASGGGQSTSAAITLMLDPGLVLSLTTPEDRRTLVRWTLFPRPRIDIFKVGFYTDPCTFVIRAVNFCRGLVTQSLMRSFVIIKP